VKPNYNHIFLHFNTELPIIVAYENFGGEAERASIAQWELIKITSPDKLYEQYIKSFGAHTVDKKGNVIKIHYNRSEEPSSTILGQHLDTYGHVIGVNLMHENKKVTCKLSCPCPPLPDIPVTDELFSSERSMLIQVNINGYSISAEIIDYEIKSSWYKEFLEIRQYSEILVEQAKYVDSKGGQIVVNKRYTDMMGAQKWRDPLYVESEEVKERLMYAVSMYKKYHKDDYKDYKYIPNKYRHICHFKKNYNEVIAPTDQLVEWKSTPAIILSEPSGESFFIEILSKLYHCVKIKEPQLSKDINVYVWNTHRAFTVGAPKTSLITYLFLKQNGIQSFVCYMVDCSK
jgi:hypothetical protein